MLNILPRVHATVLDFFPYQKLPQILSYLKKSLGCIVLHVLNVLFSKQRALSAGWQRTSRSSSLSNKYLTTAVVVNHSSNKLASNRWLIC